jgi:hypothetical protein
VTSVSRPFPTTFGVTEAYNMILEGLSTLLLVALSRLTRMVRPDEIWLNRWILQQLQMMIDRDQPRLHGADTPKQVHRST